MQRLLLPIADLYRYHFGQQDGWSRVDQPKRSLLDLGLPCSRLEQELAKLRAELSSKVVYERMKEVAYS